MTQEQHPAVDIARYFFAVCIVLMHTNTFVYTGYGYYLINLVFRLAVPFFFVCGGYFWGLKARSDGIKAASLRYIRRLLYPMIVFGCLYNLIQIVLEYRQGTTGLVLGRIAIQSVLFYPYGALWYVHACIVAVLVLWGLEKIQSPFFKGILAAGCYLFALLGNTYYFLAEQVGWGSFFRRYIEIFVSARNGLFFGFPFILIGFFVSGLSIQRANTRKLWGGVLIGFAMLLLEVVLTKDAPYLDDHALYISLPLVIPCLFMILLKARIAPGSIYPLLRNASATVFYLHRLIILTVVMVASASGFLAGGLLQTIFAVGIATLICFFVRRFDNPLLVKILT